MDADELRQQARELVRERPHRRWFQDYYRLSPRDPRYLEMTDEEIVFDFLTVEAMQEGRNTTAPRPNDSTTETFTPLQKTPGGRVRTTEIVADREEFISWYESEVGPWKE